MYSKKIEKYYKNITTAGTMDVTNQDVIMGRAGSAAKGAVLELYFRINHEGIIEEAKFQAQGCGYLLGMANYVAEQSQGKTIMAVGVMNIEDLVRFFELPEHKLYCLFMLEDCIKQAINNYQQR